MAKTPMLITGLAGALVVCLVVGGRLNKLEKDNAELTRKNSELSSGAGDYGSLHSSSRRTRSLREQGPRYIAVNYSFLEQGLQVSLPKLYGEYIESLDLSAYESRYFESLLVERLIAQQQFGLEMITGDRNDRILSTQTIARRIKENNSRIREFLNHPDDYTDFVTYEKQLPERRSLGHIRPLIAELTRETEERLIDILYQCRVKAEGECPIWETMLPSEDLESQLEAWQRCDESLAQILPSVLPHDLARNFLESWKIMRASQLKEYDLSYSLFQRG